MDTVFGTELCSICLNYGVVACCVTFPEIKLSSLSEYCFKKLKSLLFLRDSLSSEFIFMHNSLSDEIKSPYFPAQ
jgi:hypothetical protein